MIKIKNTSGKCSYTVIGDIIRIMLLSPEHRDVSLGRIYRHIMPALENGDYLIHSKEGQLLQGTVYWGWFSDKVRDACIYRGYHPDYTEFGSGNNMVVLDMIFAPHCSDTVLKKALYKHAHEQGGKDPYFRGQKKEKRFSSHSFYHLKADHYSYG